MTHGTLRLEQVTKVFGKPPNEVRAVDGVSLDVGAGEIVLIMGPSGSGKTTLLSICGALLRPSSGTVWLDGTDMTALTERELPAVRLQRLGFIFQTFNLLSNLTAEENVALVVHAAGATEPAARRSARELLGSLKMEGRLDAYPDTLSGGEKQRVAIARALANDPPVILADEPTGNLDSRTGYEVVHTLEDVAKERGKTVVIVTHDQRIVDVADRVMWLQDGELFEREPRDAVLVTDPVCGMQIDAHKAAGERKRGRRTWHFCSDRCLERFDADPDAYARRRAAATKG